MANDLIDIEDIVKTYAGNVYIKTTGQKKLKPDEVEMKVIWDRVSFVPGEPDFNDIRHIPFESASVIFESTFNNTTGNEQEHSLKAERTTTVLSNTSVTKGYTTGGNVGLSLSVPGEVVKATAAFGRQIKLEKATGTTNEKVLTWSTDDTIKVKPKSKLTAKVEIKEDEFTSKFKIDVRIGGRVLVVITNPKENNCFLQTVEASILEVLRTSEAKHAVRWENSEAVWTIHGSCNFKYGISQSINLREHN